MSRYICEQCGDDFPKSGTCEICSQPLVEMEKEEKEEVESFDDEEYN
ncbi:MAG: hypothetical protein Q8P11_01175 [bacterium]|nr:hypothetical protein [bacterium]